VLWSRCIQLFGIGVACCIACAGSACRDRKIEDGPALQILGESTRFRVGDALPQTSPWLVDGKVVLVGARGETLGIQVFHRAEGGVTLAIAGTKVSGFTVERVKVRRPSTDMYGASHGAGEYPDQLLPHRAPKTDPAYFDIAIPRDAAPGPHTGELVVAGQRVPVTLDVVPVTLPSRLDVWAYFDQREIGWLVSNTPQADKPVAREATDSELRCIDSFQAYGVMLSPDMTLDGYQARKQLLAGFPYVPAILPSDPAAVGDATRAWIAATAGTGQVPFAIPIDEPRTDDARKKVRAIADAVHAAGGGPGKFLVAVTDEPRPEYGDAIDLYIHWNAAHLIGDRGSRWTYNGKPPRAGSMVVDAETPGLRTWGWIAHRYQIPIWYVWDALYWHDRHNRKGAPLPGRQLELDDAVTFDDGDDRGNLDGVLAYPNRASRDGCWPSLRLAALRRGFQDRALLELAAKCQPAATASLAAQLVPKALGDAPSDGPPAWPTDEAAWEAARRKLLELASCATPRGGS
jgi:hypothetical protein